ncbi:hypothetical protein [Haloplanus sp.]|uniref:hypothetical protein n=1 Tax=Haloplanus sp. TaxID=1961696 RepID=UPI00261D124C|nr:hypothetical protein [Haloplanus sp.]
MRVFGNEADETVRELQADPEALVCNGADLLDDRCAGETDRERAAVAAERTVETAYEAYERRLDGPWIETKPIC